jgi:hypothetical protein
MTQQEWERGLWDLRKKYNENERLYYEEYLRWCYLKDDEGKYFVLKPNYFVEASSLNGTPYNSVPMKWSIFIFVEPFMFASTITDSPDFFKTVAIFKIYVHEKRELKVSDETHNSA